MKIGKQLRTLLDQENITQKQLAQSLNIHSTTLNGYMKDRRQPDAKTVIRLASYFHTTTDYIYGISSVREPKASPYSAAERHLLKIYRGIPKEQQLLFLETGRAFYHFEQKKKARGENR